MSFQEHAFESSQKYKEGKFIIELAHMVKDNQWEDGLLLQIGVSVVEPVKPSLSSHWSGDIQFELSRSAAISLGKWMTELEAKEQRTEKIISIEAHVMFNVVLMLVECRVSPETPFSGGLNDCETVLEHFVKIPKDEQGMDPEKTVEHTADPEPVTYHYMFSPGINIDRYVNLVKYVIVKGRVAHRLRDKVG
ncbi:unnamed protein product [Angiostrongylus costaricensis]|uniref:Yippee domain-containing protein n=1 Tax=Angiostrongylus costaricensis TaxID=334426 RepID=A0A158PEC0_ANGCS|nr:unnamed protein product [Angiostrongylus costaricensis]